MKNFTVVSDPGIDDLVALVLLHKLAPKATNCLVSTFGNATENITAQNAKEFISFVAPTWQLMHGSSIPLNNKIEHPWPDYFHGPDGVWGVHPEVDISKIKSLKFNPDSADVVSLAPLTDVYKLSKNNKIKNITLMGGAFTTEGNETQYAETNIAFDADSAHNFFREFSHIKVKVVPLDVTRKVYWTLDQIHTIPETNATDKWIKKLLLTWFDKYDHDKEKDFNLHDPLAVYLTFFPDQASWVRSGVNVEIQGKKRGQTTLDSQAPLCQIALELFEPTEIARQIFYILFDGS